MTVGSSFEHANMSGSIAAAKKAPLAFFFRLMFDWAPALYAWRSVPWLHFTTCCAIGHTLEHSPPSSNFCPPPKSANSSRFTLAPPLTESPLTESTLKFTPLAHGVVGGKRTVMEATAGSGRSDSHSRSASRSTANAEMRWHEMMAGAVTSSISFSSCAMASSPPHSPIVWSRVMCSQPSTEACSAPCRSSAAAKVRSVASRARWPFMLAS
mmetsp:Transcript_36552/g.85374  ORF Transcript_36552/g.85374 Transcript_36552/m.85374 type:complete len:211 (-) Transcript_36552:71-703(-)